MLLCHTMSAYVFDSSQSWTSARKFWHKRIDTKLKTSCPIVADQILNHFYMSENWHKYVVCFWVDFFFQPFWWRISKVSPTWFPQHCTLVADSAAAPRKIVNGYLEQSLPNKDLSREAIAKYAKIIKNMHRSLRLHSITTENCPEEDFEWWFIIRVLHGIHQATQTSSQGVWASFSQSIIELRV